MYYCFKVINRPFCSPISTSRLDLHILPIFSFHLCNLFIMGSLDVPQTQTVALVRDLGGSVEFKTDYPVPIPGKNEVLAKVLYTGVCQSGKS